jgi:hypothetical protein
MQESKYGIINLQSLIIENSINKVFTSEYSTYINDVPFIVTSSNIIFPSNSKLDLQNMKSFLEKKLLENESYIIHVIGNKYLSREFPNGSNNYSSLKLYEIIFIDNCFNKYIFRTNSHVAIIGGKHSLINDKYETNTNYNYIENTNIISKVTILNNTIDIIKSIKGNIYKVEYDPQFKKDYQLKIENNYYENIFRCETNPLYNILNHIQKLDESLRKEKEFHEFAEKILTINHKHEIDKIKS